MKCGICGGKNISLIDTKIRKIYSDKTKAYACNDCEVHFLHPYYSDDEIIEYYNGEYRKEYTHENYYLKEEVEAFFQKSIPESKIRHERVKEYLRKDEDILEIGCGAGYFLHTIKDDVLGVYGVELDERNSKYCEQIGIKMKKDISEFNKRFDKIFMFHVLEHIKEPIQFLESLKKYIKDDGLIFIEVPNNEDALLSIYDIKEYSDFYYQGAHIWYFNKNSLAYTLDKAGYNFDIYNIQRYNISNHLNWLRYGSPGGNKIYDDIFDDNLKKAYEQNLLNTDKADTIFAVCNIRTQV